VTDFFPTLLAAASLSIPSGLDGISLWPTFSSPPTQHHSTASDTSQTFHAPLAPLRTELVLNIDNDPGKPAGTINTAIIANGWKLIVGSQKFDGYFPVCNASGCARVPAADQGASLYLFNLNESIRETINYAVNRTVCDRF
jgi:hypothetical protein